MEYRRLGRSGLKVSALSYGSWLTFGPQLDLDHVRACMRHAFDHGVNFFDNAEGYARGMAESLMGEALKEYRREDVVVSTKIFWGGDGPNDRGLNAKHLIEGTNASLRRLQLDHVDLLFCHRPDPDTPIEETVRAMDVLVRQGKVFYWGTSMWSAEQIVEAHRIAREIGATPPTMEQPEYSLVCRHRVEVEYAELYERYGLGTTIWSPLASGVLTGKYLDGVPDDSRLARVSWLQEGYLLDEQRAALLGMRELASEAGLSMARLALAWCLRDPRVSTVILGASSVEQLDENLQAMGDLEGIDDGVWSRLDELFPIDPTGGQKPPR